MSKMRQFTNDQLFKMVDECLKYDKILSANWPCTECGGCGEVDLPKDWMKGESKPCPRCWGDGWEIPDHAQGIVDLTGGKYDVLDDSKVVSIWKCGECRIQSVVHMADFEGGTPVCTKCSECMTYQETRLYQG